MTYEFYSFEAYPDSRLQNANSPPACGGLGGLTSLPPLEDSGYIMVSNLSRKRLGGAIRDLQRTPISQIIQNQDGTQFLIA